MVEYIEGLPAIGEDDKVVHQLDEVTKDSEKKASELFDKLELLSNHSININNIALELEKLKVYSNDKDKFYKLVDELKIVSQSSLETIDIAMDTMQYQDIHRQKIERVINIVRALTNYMNVLFSSNIKDEDRVSSAQYIVGDNKEDVLSEEEIEEMLNQFSN